MRKLACLCALVALSGCAYYRPYVTARNNWRAVEQVQTGTEVLVHTQHGRRSGHIDTVTASGLVLREKGGRLTSIARPDVRRLYTRGIFLDGRLGNSVWGTGMFMFLSLFVLPFVDQDHYNTATGIMAAGGAAFGATIKTSYSDYIVYVRHK